MYKIERMLKKAIVLRLVKPNVSRNKNPVKRYYRYNKLDRKNALNAIICQNH